MSNFLRTLLLVRTTDFKIYYTVDYFITHYKLINNIYSTK
jgi:hypothetical protein